MNIGGLVDIAAAVARSKEDERGYLIGAIGQRMDGVLVTAYNGSSPHKCSAAHAEIRLLRKLGRRAKFVLVVRVKKGSGRIGIAKPCPKCMAALKASKVEMIMWSIGKSGSMYQYGEEVGRG